jgi:hypothetical protein
MSADGGFLFLVLFLYILVSFYVLFFLNATLYGQHVRIVSPKRTKPTLIDLKFRANQNKDVISLYLLWEHFVVVKFSNLIISIWMRPMSPMMLWRDFFTRIAAYS